MDSLPLQIQQARKSGYSDDEILSYLQKQNLGPQIQQAQKAGYSSAEIINHLGQPPALVDTATKYSAGSGAANFLDAIPRGVVNAGNLVRAGAGYVGGKLGMKPENLPDMIPSDTLDFANPLARKLGLVNDQYAPTTAAGKVADFATQALTGGGLNPAAIGRQAIARQALPIVRDVTAATASGAGAGLGSAAAENVNTGNESLDNAIKAGATVLGGAVPGMTIAARGTAGDRVSAAVRGVTDQQMALARELARKADRMGSPVTGYEAIQSVTGTNPKMQTQQRVAEQSDAAGGALTQFMQNRPQANTNLVNNAVDQIAPTEPFPDVLAGQLQKAAQGSIDAARKEGNAKASPYYAATSNDPSVRVPSSTWNSLASDPAVQAALQAVKSDPFTGLQNASEGSLQWLDAAKKWLDSKSEAAQQSGDRFQGKNLTAASSKITGAVDPIFPDYAKARQVVADNMQQNVEPMEASQIGKLSRSDNFGEQSRALLPRKPLDVNENVVSRTAQTIGAQDPEILPKVLAQDLRADFNESNQGTNPMGGAQWAKLVADNQQQRANLIQAIKETGADPTPVTDALDVFHAQGYKPAVNSATTANASEAAKLSGTLSLLTRPLQAAPDMVDSWRNGWSSRQLAQALSSGGSTVDDLAGLARTNGTYNPSMQQMMINLLLGSQQPQPQSQ